MGIYCTTHQIQNTSVTMGVLKKLRRLDHRTLSMIALFPLRKKHTSIQHSQGKKGVTQFVNNPVHKTQFSFNYWTYWSIFQLSLEYSNKQLEVVQIAVFVTRDTLRGMYKMEHLLNPVCFLSPTSQDMHRRVWDFHMRLRKKSTVIWGCQDFYFLFGFHSIFPLVPSGKLT